MLGGRLFAAATEMVGQLNLYALEGAKMVFGPLADSAKLDASFGPGSGVFAILIAATIILISALSACVYCTRLLGCHGPRSDAESMTRLGTQPNQYSAFLCSSVVSQTSRLTAEEQRNAEE